MSLRDQILKDYLDAQRGLTEVEQVDENNVILSLPLHFSANTRVELAVTRITDSYFAISDMAHTLGELKDAGYGIAGKLKEKIRGIAKAGKIEFAGNHLVRKCSSVELGDAIHEFADVAKTIGDAYLTYGARKLPEEEDELIARVRSIFSKRKYVFKEKQEINGDIEMHTIDFYISPNGNKGLALAVLPNPIKIVAEAWGFKSRDIKNANKNVAIGIVYDSARAKEDSKAIFQSTVDIPVPSNAIEDLANRLDKAGVLKH
jgi:hypothetical protein